MKHKIIAFILSAFSFTISYSQNAFSLSSQSVDFAFVKASQDLKYTFKGEFCPVDFDLDKSMSKEMNPAGKGALIGFGIGAGVGLLSGILIAAAETTFVTIGNAFGAKEKTHSAGWIIGGTFAGGALGTGIGALIGGATKKKSGEEVSYFPETNNFSSPDLGLRSYTVQPEFQIITLGHSF